MKIKITLLFALILLTIGVKAQVGVAAADTSLRATVAGIQQVWKSKAYYQSLFNTIYNKTQSDARFANTQTTIRYTPIYSPTAGGTTLTIPEFANTVPISIIRGNQEYKVSGSATETTVSVNTATGLVTTHYAFGTSETIYGVYQGVTPSTILTDGFGFSILQNYTDIVTNVHWGGSAEWTFYIQTDFQNMSGKKGAYKYIPGFTPTPAQIAINFND